MHREFHAFPSVSILGAPCLISLGVYIYVCGESDNSFFCSFRWLCSKRQRITPVQVWGQSCPLSPWACDFELPSPTSLLSEGEVKQL
ncbi:hypothetical protein XELAEV_18025778mg [Xenopus laevis]|uniref:Uncharacterized protein n=1 Tax=Xenopus laevis TaxID=8355 RepID=A0A974D2M0_XENLA|nr:hypothetical protein XELAEV_18025778mg [Xenopus laevis]